jgi:hypothetical protein
VFLDQGYDLINTRLDLGLQRFGLLLKLSDASLNGFQ